MVPDKILQRTFFIKYNESYGSSFAFEYECNQYLATAHHIVKNLNGPSELQIFYKVEWRTINVNPVFSGDSDADLSILSIPYDIAPRHEICIGTSDIFLSEDAYIVGFPLRFYQEDPGINNGWPIPIVAKGCV